MLMLNRLCVLFFLVSASGDVRFTCACREAYERAGLSSSYGCECDMVFFFGLEWRADHRVRVQVDIVSEEYFFFDIARALRRGMEFLLPIETTSAAQELISKECSNFV